MYGLEELGKASKWEDLDLSFMKDKAVPLDDYHTLDEPYNKRRTKFYAPYDFWEERICALSNESTLALKVIPTISPGRLSFEETAIIQEVHEIFNTVPTSVTKIVGMLNVVWYANGKWDGHSVCIVWNISNKTITLHDAAPGSIMLIRAVLESFNMLGTPKQPYRVLEVESNGHTYVSRKSNNSCVLMSHMSAEIEMRNIDLPPHYELTENLQYGYAAFINPKSTILADFITKTTENIGSRGAKCLKRTPDRFENFNFKMNSVRYNATLRGDGFYFKERVHFKEHVSRLILNAKTIKGISHILTKTDEESGTAAAASDAWFMQVLTTDYNPGVFKARKGYIR